MKKVIITWVSSGIGKSLAKVFNSEWYDVIWLCRSKPTDFVTWIETDLTNEWSLNNACEVIKKEHWKFECIVQCAGDGYGEWIDSLQWQKTEQIFRLNTIAPIVMTSQLLELTKVNEADIINIWATIWFKPYQYFSVYGASKWAMRGWIENLQLEFKNTKSRIIGIHPWWVDTSWNERRRGEIKEASWKENWSWFMSPDDIAGFILQIYKLPKNMEVSEVIINRK